MTKIFFRALAFISLLSLALFAFQLYSLNYDLELALEMSVNYLLCFFTFIIGSVHSFKNRYRESEHFLFPLLLLLLSIQYINVLPNILSLFSIVISEYYLLQITRYLRLVTAIIFLLAGVHNLKDVANLEAAIIPILVVIYAMIQIIPINLESKFNYTNFCVLIILVGALVLYIAAIIKNNTLFYYLRFLTMLLLAVGFYLNIFRTDLVVTIVVLSCYFVASILILCAKSNE